MKALFLLFLFMSAGGPLPLNAESRAKASRKALEEVRQQLEEKKQELERYKQEEKDINREIDQLRMEDKRSVGRQKELAARLLRSRAARSDAKEKFDSLSKAYQGLQDDLYGETVTYSLEKQFYYPYCGLEDISRALLLKSAIILKQNLINKIKGETVKVQDDLRTYSKRNLELEAQKQLVDKRRSAHRKEVRSKMTELERTRRQQARLSREVDKLQEDSLGLTKLVKKLEKKAPYRPASARSRELPVPRHSLPWPVRGEVISRYGREEVPLLKTWIVREGIRIRSAESAPVFPVMSGKVIYSGPFRTYGNVVIVDHEQGFFTVYGLLDGILVAKNDAVTPGSPLGHSGRDLLDISGGSDKDRDAVYFEIRVGSVPIDPMLWLTN